MAENPDKWLKSLSKCRIITLPCVIGEKSVLLLPISSSMSDLQSNWYAVKVFFNKVFTLEGKLEAMGLETYLPVAQVQLKGREHLAASCFLARNPHSLETIYIREGPVIYQRKPLVTSLLFFKAQPSCLKEVEEYLCDPLGSIPPRGFIYKNAERKAYAVIPDSQMKIFRLVADSGASGLEFFADDDITRFKKGDKVRVKEGLLKGAEGYIKRIRKDRRLLVSIDGIIAVATSYIPPDQLERV